MLLVSILLAQCQIQEKPLFRSRESTTFPIIVSYQSKSTGHLRLLLDSGANISILDYSRTKSRVKGISQSDVHSGQMILSNEVATLEQERITSSGFYVTDGIPTDEFYKELKVDGLIGRPMFDKLIIGLDYKTRSVKIWNHDLKNKEWMNWIHGSKKKQVLSIKIPGSIRDGYFSTLKIGDFYVPLLVDTGASITMIPDRFVNTRPNKLIGEVDVLNADGRSTQNLLMLPDLSSDEISIVSPIVSQRENERRAVASLDLFLFERCYMDFGKQTITGASGNLLGVNVANTVSRILNVNVSYDEGGFLVQGTLPQAGERSSAYVLDKCSYLKFSDLQVLVENKETLKITEFLERLFDLSRISRNFSVKGNGKVFTIEIRK